MLLLPNLTKALALAAGRVLIWDAVSGEQRRSLEGPGEAVNWVQWHPRGNVLLAGSEDFTAWLWNAQTGACMHVRGFLEDMLQAHRTLR